MRHRAFIAKVIHVLLSIVALPAVALDPLSDTEVDRCGATRYVSGFCDVNQLLADWGPPQATVLHQLANSVNSKTATNIKFNYVADIEKLEQLKNEGFDALEQIDIADYEARDQLLIALLKLDAELKNSEPETRLALTITAGTPTYSLAFNSSSYDFGEVPVGSQSAPQIATLTNTGTGTVTFQNGYPSVSYDDGFVISNSTCGTTLAPGAHCELTVNFQPMAVGSPSLAYLAVRINESIDWTFASLQGTGTAAETYSLVFDSSFYDFGEVQVGSQSVPQIATLTNTGTGTVTFQNGYPSVSYDDGFVISNSTCGTTLAPGAHCELTVHFQPVVVGSPSLAYLAVRTNESIDMIFASLYGTGTPTSIDAYTLNINKVGSGTITSSPAGISCGTTCSGDFESGTTVTLSATSATGAVFTGWGGACSGTTPTCTLNMSGSKTVLANFGGVIPAAPTALAASAITTTGFQANWEAVSGALGYRLDVATDRAFTQSVANYWDLDTGNTQRFTVSGLQAGTQYYYRVRAYNDAGEGVASNTISLQTTSETIRYTLSVSKTGNGRVTSSPIGINCGESCVAKFTKDTSVQLTATPDAGYQFTGWSGACSGTGTCTTAMTQNQSVQASFSSNRAPDFKVTGVTLTPTNPVANTTFSAKITVKNEGTVAGVPGLLQVWTNQGTQPACQALGNASTRLTNSLNPGASVSVTLTGLKAGTAGSRTFRAFVDSDCATEESLETNNQATKTYTVKPPQPDFVVTGITLTRTSPAANSTFSVKVTVKNQGALTGNGGYLDLWTSSLSVPTCGAEGNAWASVGTLAAGASKVLTFTMNAGRTGSKTLRAFVDSWCETDETNNANNQKTKAYTVQP